MSRRTMLVIALAAWAAACGAPPAGGEDAGNSPPLAGEDDGIPSDDHPAICGNGHRLTAAGKGEEHCSNPIVREDPDASVDDPAVVPDAGANDPTPTEDPNRTADGGCAPAPWPYRELSPCPKLQFCRLHQQMDDCLWDCGERHYTPSGDMYWGDIAADIPGDHIPGVCDPS